MKTSIIAASLLFAGVLAAVPLTASAAQKDKGTHAAATKVQSAWASGTLEKFDATTRTLVIKHDGKDQSYTVGDGVSVKNGAKAGTVQDLSTSIGHQVKLEYAMNSGTKAVSLVEISAAPRPAKAGK